MKREIIIERKCYNMMPLCVVTVQRVVAPCTMYGGIMNDKKRTVTNV